MVNCGNSGSMRLLYIRRHNLEISIAFSQHRESLRSCRSVLEATWLHR